jgi:equilibrative nucleoside transporter 1/2/3
VRWDTIRATYRQNWPEAVSVWLLYTVSLSVYPGLMFQLSWFGIGEQWLAITIVGCWNTSDCIGRYIGTKIPPISKSTLIVATIVRVIGVVAIVLALPVCKIEYLQSASWYSVTLNVVLALSNGVLGTGLMISGTKCESDRDVAGYIMAFHLTLGLASGSVIAYFLAVLLI